MNEWETDERVGNRWGLKKEGWELPNPRANDVGLSMVDFVKDLRIPTNAVVGKLAYGSCTRVRRMYA